MKEFIRTWCSRHKHPANAVLHAVGIPATIIGVALFFFKPVIVGVCWIVFGYALQVIGHKIEGSEIGELMLFKHIYTKLLSSRR